MGEGGSCEVRDKDAECSGGGGCSWVAFVSDDDDVPLRCVADFFAGIRRDCMPDATVHAITPYDQYYTYRFLHRMHKNKGNLYVHHR
jgi:hypothetical protein